MSDLSHNEDRNPTGHSRDGKSEAKRAAILAAAAAQFLEKGFGGSSMDSIATEASVSKQTVYAHFGGKAQLFGAIIRQCKLQGRASSIPFVRLEDSS